VCFAIEQVKGTVGCQSCNGRPIHAQLLVSQGAAHRRTTAVEGMAAYILSGIVKRAGSSLRASGFALLLLAFMFEAGSGGCVDAVCLFLHASMNSCLLIQELVVGSQHACSPELHQRFPLLCWCCAVLCSQETGLRCLVPRLHGGQQQRVLQDWQ
jgi:hypothetical protein